MRQEVKNLEELKIIANGFMGSLLRLPVKNTATVVGLSGDLGAGKTAFTKCIAESLGITEIITSPTFVLEKIYDIPENSIFGARFSKLVHIDAYRLEEGGEMKALGWQALLNDRHNLVFLEWPEQVASALPEDMITLSFEFVREGVRRITGNLQ